MSAAEGRHVPGVRIVTDSTAYVPDAWRERYGIEVVSLGITEGDLHAQREVDMDWAAFYERMRASSELPKSSQPPPADFLEVFERAAASGEAVCGVFISSGMSGTFSGAESARETVLAAHPDAVIELVDSKTTSAALAYLVRRAADKALEGADAAACAQAAREGVRCARWLVMPDSLDNLYKGGRLSGAAALVGSALQILPIITVDEGIVVALKRIRTRRRQIDEAVAFFAGEIARHGLAELAVLQIEEASERDALAARVAEIAGKEPDLFDVGPVVGLHVGPGIGIAYLTREPIEGAAS